MLYSAKARGNCYGGLISRKMGKNQIFEPKKSQKMGVFAQKLAEIP